MSPSNQTVMYGEIAEFTCQIPTCGDSLFMQVNGITVVSDAAPFNSSHNVKLIPELHPKEYGGGIEYSCDGQESPTHTLKFWFVVNERTLREVNYVNCKRSSNILSNNAYITVVYPKSLRASVCSTNQGPTAASINNNVSCNSVQGSKFITTTSGNKGTKQTSSLTLSPLCLLTLLILYFN